jgi:predicted Ser/Thr protein kinase
MTDQKWGIVWKIFSEVRELSEGERSAAVAAAPLAPELREELLALLEQSTFVSGVLSFPQAPVPEPEYSPGTELGRYVIVGVAGQGGFGRVYAARDKDLRRSVAVKVIAANLAGHGERLIEEARAASALNHPNIVTIHETIEIDGRLAMVMEFVQGESLRKTLQSAAGPLPLAQTLECGRQIAQALEAAHAAGIAHRDVKPENILLRPDGYVKLVDFGLAIDLSPEERDAPRNFTGTLRYMAPEQLEGEASTARSDIFSFGMVLYEMAAGIHPFRGETPLDTAEAIARKTAIAPSRLNPSIPEEMDRLILAMLSKDPNHRPSAAQAAATIARIPTRPARVKLAWSLLVALMPALVALALWRPWTHPAPPVLSLKATPLTGNEGREGSPSLSPDGRSVVYEWQERLDGPTKTILREIGSENATVLPIQGPFTWTPGGDRIGFIRQDTLFTISRNGGPVEKSLPPKIWCRPPGRPLGKSSRTARRLPRMAARRCLSINRPQASAGRSHFLPPAFPARATLLFHRTAAGSPFATSPGLQRAISTLQTSPRRAQRASFPSTTRTERLLHGSATAQESLQPPFTAPTTVFGTTLRPHRRRPPV